MQMYNAGALALSDRSVDFLADTLEFVLLKSSYTPNKDHLAATVLASEISGVTGYTGGHAGAGRKVLGTKTLVKNDTTDRVVYDAADPAWTALGAGDTIGYIAVIKRGAADDTTAVALALLQVSPAVPTNGSDFNVTLAAAGLMYQQV